MAVVAWECSSQGKLGLGPDTAKLTAAHVHLESGLVPEALEFKHAPPFSLLGSKASKRKVVNTCHLHSNMLQTRQCLSLCVY